MIKIELDAGQLGELIAGKPVDVVGTSAMSRPRRASVSIAPLEHVGALVELLIAAVRPSDELRNMTEPEIRAMLDCVGMIIERITPDDMHGFSLLLTDVDGFANYVSNLKRDDVPQLFREAANKIEHNLTLDRGPDDEG